MQASLLLVLALAFVVSGQVVLTGYDHDVELGGALSDGHVASPGTFHLYYSFRPPFINIGIVADTRDTTGWASFGISNNGLMNPGDVALGIIDAQGPHLADFFLSGKQASLNNFFCANGIGATCYDPIEQPINGTSCTDNFSNQTITRNGNLLILQYTRPIAASDFCDLPINTAGPSYIIYAVGPIVSTYQFPFNAQYHTYRANTTFTFIATPPPTTAPTVATTASTTQVNQSTVAQTTVAQTTAVVATSAPVTTGAPIGTPPILTGYAHDIDFSKNLTNGFTAAPYPNYYHLYYTYAPPTLSIGIVAYSVDGWLAIGWSPSGIMDTPGVPSDAVLAYVDPNGQTFLTDFVLLGRNAPGSAANCAGTTTGICSDVSLNTNCLDNANLKSITRQNGYLIVQFTRPVVASDKCDIAVLPTGAANQNVIIAVGPTINSQPWPYSVQFHYYHNNGTTAFNWIASTNGSTQVAFSVLMVLVGLIASLLM